MSDDVKVPGGIVALLLDGGGRVMAEAMDFNTGGSAGFKQWEAQRLRVRRAVAHEYIRGVCPPVLADAICKVGYRGPEEIIKHMCSEAGWRLHLVAVGYGPDVEPNR